MIIPSKCRVRSGPSISAMGAKRAAVLWPVAIATLALTPARLASAADWSGAYGGVSLGYATGDDEAQEINGPRNYLTEFGGFTASAHLGWQRQIEGLVAGVELEGGYLDLGADITRDVAGGSVTSDASLGAYGTLTGRLGVVLHSDWLLYGRIGVAMAALDAETVQTCTGADLCGGAQSTPVSSAETQDETFGLVLGAGVERQLGGMWTGRLDYQFINFRDELALPALDGPGWEHEVDVHAVKLGLSRRF